MSKQQDILFCKIAISTGMVSQEQAQKCLAIADKREKEGRRPLIGAVFTKYKLMDQAAVQRINTAVSKRLGGTALPGTTKSSKKKKRGAGKRRREPAARPRGAPPKREPTRVDPNTLWMGIGTGVVFLGVIITIVVMYIQNSTGSAREKKGGSSDPMTANVGGGGGSGNKAADSVASAEKKAASADEARREAAMKEVDPVFKGEHAKMIQIARQEIAYDKPDQAKKMIERFLEERKLDYQAGGGHLREQAEALLAQISGEGDEDSEGSDEDIDLIE